MKRTGMGRLARLTVALVVVATGLTVSGTLPATAQDPPDPPVEGEEPIVKVTPSSGLRHGEVVQVELTGFAGEQVMIVACPAQVFEFGNPWDWLACAFANFSLNPHLMPVDVTTSPAVVEGGLRIFEWPEGRCDAAGECVVAAFATPRGSGPEATTPIQIETSPLAVRPYAAPAGTTVKATVGGEPGPG
jgi:hypothetical protein